MTVIDREPFFFISPRRSATGGALTALAGEHSFICFGLFLNLIRSFSPPSRRRDAAEFRRSLFRSPLRGHSLFLADSTIP
jgi:hypothetical protein